MAATEEELARLAQEGVPADQLIWTAYSFSHFLSQRGKRHAFRDALTGAGFTDCGTTEELTGNGYWHHWSHTIRPADPEVLIEANRVAGTIAAEHGVRYDEWMVTRDSGTGELRPVAADR